LRITAVEIDGALHFVECAIIFAEIERRVAEQGVCRGIEFVQRDRPAREALCPLQSLAGVCRPAVANGANVHSSQPDIGRRVLRIELDRALEQPARLGVVSAGESGSESATLQH